MKVWSSLRTISCLFAGLLVLPGASVQAAKTDKLDPLLQSSGDVSVRVRVRNAGQIAAFYEARGFPGKALKVLSKHCFLTVTIRNHSKKVVWLMPARWSFEFENSKTAALPPLTASYWKKTWRKTGLSAAYQSTFRWTQLPDKRDLRPSEPVGGNISLPRMPGKFTLNVVFPASNKGESSNIHMRFRQLSCVNG